MRRSLAIALWLQSTRLVGRVAELGSLDGIEHHRMSSHPKQIVVSEPLWSFMHYCEVYCSGACCGIQAFEVHPALLLRKTIDMNLATKDGSASFEAARRQMTELRRHVSSQALQTVNDEVPFWNGESSELPEFWLPVGEVADWLVKWETSFTEASRYGGLDKHAD